MGLTTSYSNLMQEKEACYYNLQFYSFYRKILQLWVPLKFEHHRITSFGLLMGEFIIRKIRTLFLICFLPDLLLLKSGDFCNLLGMHYVMPNMVMALIVEWQG